MLLCGDSGLSGGDLCEVCVVDIVSCCRIIQNGLTSWYWLTHIVLETVLAIIMSVVVRFIYCCVKSLSGHSSPVEAVSFGHLEDVVAAGSLSGSLKIWDLEANKSLLLRFVA